MKKQIFSLALILTLISSVSFAQTSVHYDGPNKRERDSIAADHILNLKDGVLLVRLQTSEKRITALENSGHTQEAADARREQQVKNNLIVKAFSVYYDFTEVYFFYADQSSSVKERKWDGILFSKYMDPLREDAIGDKPVYVLASSGAGLKNLGSDQIGFGMLDSEMTSLDKPFPYYITKKTGSKIFEKSYAEMVQLYQIKLVDFHAKTKGQRRPKHARVKVHGVEEGE